MTVGECLDDFDTRLEKNEVRKMRFKVRFTRDDQEDIMTYNEIVDFMTRDTNEENGNIGNSEKSLDMKRSANIIRTAMVVLTTCVLLGKMEKSQRYHSNNLHMTHP